MTASAPQESTIARATTVDLALLSQAIDEHLAAGRPEEAAAVARLVLLRLPRHLPTYQRILRATWLLKRWQEGEDWARRLLQADPGNPLAWRALAYAVEQKGLRTTAQAMWMRAFEHAPYDPDIRSGLQRTSLDDPGALALNAACLANLYLRGGRWAHAAGAYRTLAQADPRRTDFRAAWLVASWQQGAHQEAYQLAHHLTQRQPYVLFGWVVLSVLGDVNDRTLAHNPLSTMDPDGDFVRSRFAVTYEGARTPISLTAEEARGIGIRNSGYGIQRETQPPS